MKKLLTLAILLLSLQTQGTNRGDMTERGYILCSISDKYKHVAKYINSIWDDSEWCSKKYNIPQALIIAQMCLESKYGLKPIKLNNHLGIRLEGRYVEFASIRNCLDIYGRTLNNGCYKKHNPKSIDEWLYALQWSECKYHESKKYSSKIRWIIRTFNLDVIPLA